MQAFSLVLQTLRAQRGISQETLAEISGLERGTIWGLEHEKRNPKLTTLVYLWIALQPTPEQVMAAITEIARQIALRG